MAQVGLECNPPASPFRCWDRIACAPLALKLSVPSDLLVKVSWAFSLNSCSNDFTLKQEPTVLFCPCKRISLRGGAIPDDTGAVRCFWTGVVQQVERFRGAPDSMLETVELLLSHTVSRMGWVFLCDGKAFGSRNASAGWAVCYPLLCYCDTPWLELA